MKKIESVQEKCPNCGGNMIYCPATHDLHCANCKTSIMIVDDGKIVHHDLNTKQESLTDDEYATQNKMFKCPNCGADVLLSKYEISQICPYCSTSLVMQDGSFKGIKPDSIIPFEFDETEASKRFMLGIKRKFWVPSKLKKSFPENQISGIYIPAFGFDANTSSRYSGTLYNEYHETDSDGHSTTRREYFHISGTHNQKYEDIIVECSSKINQKELMGFLPFRFEEKKPYKNAYILGYSVEQYSNTVKECIPQYESSLESIIRKDVLRKYSYDGVSSLNIDTQRSDEKYLYHLLPVYRFDYKYKNKDYITYMNGQTGKVDNNVPKSALKITLVTLLIVLFFLVPIIICVLAGLSH